MISSTKRSEVHFAICAFSNIYILLFMECACELLEEIAKKCKDHKNLNAWSMYLI